MPEAATITSDNHISARPTSISGGDHRKAQILMAIWTKQIAMRNFMDICPIGQYSRDYCGGIWILVVLHPALLCDFYFFTF